MIRRRDNDSYIGVAGIAMAALSLVFLVITNASNFWLILLICGVATLAGTKIADILVGYPHRTGKDNHAEATDRRPSTSHSRFLR